MFFIEITPENVLLVLPVGRDGDEWYAWQRQKENDQTLKRT
jgi:hypothetical protein